MPLLVVLQLLAPDSGVNRTATVNASAAATLQMVAIAPPPVRTPADLITAIRCPGTAWHRNPR